MAWIEDGRASLRRLKRAPGFASAAVLMLALGIAFSVCMFSVVRGVLLGALPYSDSAALVSVDVAPPGRDDNRGQLTPAEAVALAEATTAGRAPFRGFGYYNWGGITLFDAQHPRESSVAIVSDGFFPTLGLKPELGRWFTPEEHVPKSGTVVLSHAEWQRLLGGRADAIGQTIDSSEGRLRVVGVMPAAFAYPAPSVGAWLPRRAYDASRPSYAHARFVFGVGRLASAEADPTAPLAAIAAEVRRDRNLPDDGWRLATSTLLEDLVGYVEGPLWGAFALALLVLLIACANVAILFDARQLARAGEVALVHALGASPGRIRRSAVFELGGLALAGAALGTVLAGSGLDLLRRFASDSLPRVAQVTLDPGVLLFAIALALATPLLVIAAGALRRRAQVPAVAPGRGVIGGDSRMRRLVPGFALALSTVSLVVASALGMSLWRLAQVEPGFRSTDVRALQLFRAAPAADWPVFARELRDRLAAVPGVLEVAQTSAAPLSNNGSMNVDLQVAGRAEPEPFQAALRRVDGGYAPLLGIPIRAGRGISTDEPPTGERVAVINETLARRVFGTSAAVGQVLGLPLGQGDRIPYRVVGVMGDIRNNGLRADPAPEILVSAAQDPWASMTFLVRTAGDMPGLDRQLAEQVWAIDPRQAVTRQFALREDLDAQLASIRFFAATTGAFALAAQLLGLFGIYAVTTLQQRRRVREFGLRLALGARPATLGATMLREGLLVVAAGTGFGVLGAMAALPLVAAQTFGIDGQVHWPMLVGVAGIALGALAALAVPVLRAARTDPMVSLRAVD